MGGGRAGGGMTSLLGGNGTAGVSAELVTLLQAGDYEWAAATMRANSAAPLQLASGEPVMAVGGFNGTDGTFTLAQFQEYVAAGRIHYFVAEGSGGGRGMDTSTTDDITTWVTENFTATTVGSTTLYDLTEGN
ncbi:MAG: glycosyl transferase [Nocardioidaceae bacterium]|nr:glycosyl transferase [Nocardioidaceae bacterium]